MTTTHFSYRPTTQGLGAEVDGLNLASALTDGEISELKQRLGEYGVLLIREQLLNERQQLAFIEQFGELQGHPVPNVAGPAPVDQPDERVFYLTNGLDGAPAKPKVKRAPGAAKTDETRHRRRSGWHSDLQYMPDPQVYSMLHSLEIPVTGGDTEWCDMAAAYLALPADEQNRLSCLFGLNQVHFLREQAPVRHPLVRVHPITGKRCLYLSPSITQAIDGMAPDESETLITSLTDHATQSQFCYRHQWQVHDTLIWDNRGTMHVRHPFDMNQRRVVRRTQTVGEPIVAAVA